MNKDTNKSTFDQVLFALSQQNQRFKSDRYTKKLSTLQLINLLVIAQINQEPSLRDISNSLNHEGMKEEIGIDSFHYSNISRRLRSLDTGDIKKLFKDLVVSLGIKNGFAKTQQQLGSLNLIDSTTISLCLTRYPWAEFRKTKSGIKA